MDHVNARAILHCWKRPKLLYFVAVEVHQEVLVERRLDRQRVQWAPGNELLAASCEMDARSGERIDVREMELLGGEYGGVRLGVVLDYVELDLAPVAECVNNFETPVVGSLVSNAALPRVRVAWVLES